MKYIKSLIGTAGALAVALGSSSGIAEDIDLFLGLPTSAADAPNVLFVIDNTANWSQNGDDGRDVWDSEKEALAQIFRDLDDGVVNVGMLLYTETGGGNSNTDGGYIRSAIRLMDAATKELYAAQIESCDGGDDKGNGGKSAVGFAEAYLYFSGDSPEAGNNKVKTDYLNNSSGVSAGGTVSVTDGVLCGYKNNGRPKTCSVTVPGGVTADGAVWGLPLNALDAKGGNPYNSPVPDGYCGKNYIIFLSNGPNQDNSSDTRRAETILASLGGDTSQISITPGGNASNASDEWSRFMKSSAYGITTFTIDVNKATNGQGPNWTAVLKSIADESGGTYYEPGANVTGISEAVNDALSRILAVNSVFSSVALPASANTQSTFINQVYIGLFRPDEDANPRWVGNLKQYRLAFDSSSGTNVLRLHDAALIPSPAIDSGTGFIRECAQSFWTPGSLDTYWSYLDPADQRGECTAVANSAQSNYPDGPIVEKGGQAYMARGGSSYASAVASSRTVKTMAQTLCGSGTSPATCASLTNFDNANTAIQTADVGAVSSAERTDFINWARGADVQDEDGDSDVAEPRPSLHADVIHSQPIAIDYAADPNNPRVVVFYGGNDGMLRAINGNRTTAHNGLTVGSGTAAGAEFWAFMPPDFYPQVGRLYENSTVIKFPATGAAAAATGSPKPYGPDGPLTAWDNGVTNRYVYQGMRRGGRTIYGFDATAVGSPSLLFRLGCTTPTGDNSDCATGWNDVGETWSPLSLAFVSGQTDPYIMMGGGYDACEDYDDPNAPANHDCGSGTDGDKIYVLNATTGAIEKAFDTDRAVPGKVTIVRENDGSPYISYAYAADTGGNVYRISGWDGTDIIPIGITLPSTWIITKIADLGCGTKSNSTCTANRKFLFGPDVINPVGSSQNVVLVGSGDREKPLADYGGAASVQNYFFALFDQPATSTWLSSESATCNASSMCLDSLTAVDPNGPLVAGTPISAKGWKLQLRAGEQVVSGALGIADIVNFSTHIPVQPDATACSTDLGTATTYNVDYTDGEGDTNLIIGGGLVPTPVAGLVELDDGTVVPFCIGCGGENSAIGGSEVTGAITWEQGKSRVYWKIEK